MKIQLNDKEILIQENTSLLTILQNELHITPEKKGIAVAVNGQVIPKNEWANYHLKDNDNIFVIIAAQGG